MKAESTMTFFQRSLSQPIFHMALRLFIAAVFIYASWDKILHPDAFAKAVYNYHILPDNLVNFTALVLPWLELFLGICLILGFWMPGALFIINGLLLIFFGALLFNLTRGLNIDCGCFGASGQSSKETPMIWYIMRDIAFLICSGILYLQVLRKEGEKTE